MFRSLSVLVLLSGLVMAGEELPALDLPAVAVKLVACECDGVAWLKYQEDARTAYVQWASDNRDASFARYLDDTLHNLASAARGGKPERLKKFAYWLALYAAFSDAQVQYTPPSWVRSLDPEAQAELNLLLKDFSWEKASAIIKRRVEAYDKTKGVKTK